MLSLNSVSGRASAASKTNSRRSRKILQFACESLEIRRLLTSQLYLDFGDSFPAGGLGMTVLTLRDTFGNSGLQGPDLRQADNGTTTTVNEAIADTTNLNFAPTSPLVTFDYDQNGTVNNADYTSLRANVLALVQRYYAPFDVNVQIAPALDNSSNANYVTAVRTLLQQGANTDGEYDGYCFISNVTRTSDGLSVGNLTSNFGISNGADIANNNSNDNSEIAFSDQILGAALASGLDADTRLGYTAAHEPGHDFGLPHTNNGFGSDGSSASGNTTTDNDMILQTSSNVVTGSANNTPRQNLDVFTRFPLVRGDGNSVVGGGFNINNTTNHYNILASNNNLGLKSGFAAYVTGTGAFDQITLSSGGGSTVNVSLSTFREAAFTNQIGATQNYSVDSSNGILIETGFNADQVTINANINASITLHGMAGNDSLIVLGNSAATGSFTPGSASSVALDDNTYLSGTLVAGSSTINISEYAPGATISVQDITSFTYKTPNAADNVTIDTPDAGRNRASGTSGGVQMLPVSFKNVANFILDTGANDGAGTGDIVLVATNGPAAGLNTIAINTGGGNDDVRVGFAAGNPVPSGGLSYDGGSGTADLLTLSGGSFTNETYVPSGPGSGTINLDGSVITYTNLAPIDDIVTVANLTFNATAGADAINIVNGPILAGVQTDQINSGNGTFERLNFGNKSNVVVNAQNGADTLHLAATVSADGLSSLALNGEDAANAGDDLAGDTFNINSTIGGVSLTGNGGGGADSFNVTGTAGGSPTFNGQDGNDTFTVAGAGLGSGSLNLNGNTGNDQFFLTSSVNSIINADGGTHTTEDLLDMNGESLDYTISPTAFTAGGRQSLNYLNIEALTLNHGTFGLNATIPQRVSVDQDGKLYGTGTVLGVVTATLNGIISPGVSTGGATGIFNTGSITFAPTSSYQVQINGLVNGTEHDVLNVTGTVSLGGSNLDLAASITAVPGDEFMIIHNDGVDPIAGKFAQGDMITIGSQKFAIDYAYDGDGDGNLNDVALIRYGAALAPDPCDSNLMALFVSATTGADTIRFFSDEGNPRIHVIINNDDFGVFEPTGLLIGFGQSGDDTITVEVPSRRSWLYGQGGNDTVTSGNNDSILLGGIGNDLLTGGNGKDIFIGGKGSDVLRGGNGDDVLVAGASAYETNTAANRKALCGIQDEWTKGGGSIAQRIDHLTNGGGLNGSSVFNGTTVFEDSAIDSLFGENGKDWFVMNSSGGGVLDFSDATKADIVSDL